MLESWIVYASVVSTDCHSWLAKGTGLRYNHADCDTNRSDWLAPTMPARRLCTAIAPVRAQVFHCILYIAKQGQPVQPCES